jgi:riboflavin biosynthesis pyrimidine reductase
LPISWVGASFTSKTFVSAVFVDEFVLTIRPVLIGTGAFFVEPCAESG